MLLWDWVWIQGFMLAKQVLHRLNYASRPFHSGYFGHEVSQTIAWAVLEPKSSQSQPPK
jgi:hypothetical protein